MHFDKCASIFPFLSNHGMLAATICMLLPPRPPNRFFDRTAEGEERERERKEEEEEEAILS